MKSLQIITLVFLCAALGLVIFACVQMSKAIEVAKIHYNERVDTYNEIYVSDCPQCESLKHCYDTKCLKENDAIAERNEEYFK